MRFIVLGVILATAPAWADRSYTEEEIRKCREAEAGGDVLGSFCERLLKQEGSEGEETAGADDHNHDDDSYYEDCVRGEGDNNSNCEDRVDDAYDSRRAERLDERGDRREERLEDRGDRAADRGNEERSERLEDRGDRVDDRLDDRADRVEERKDDRDNRQESRQSRRSAAGRN